MKATAVFPATKHFTAGQQSEVPSAVDIRYFTANGASVTHKQREASGADTGSHADRALSSDGSRVVWDQALLAAHPTCFVFSPDSPQLSVSGIILALACNAACTTSIVCFYTLCNKDSSKGLAWCVALQ
jgi:hypothetical protein